MSGTPGPTPPQPKQGNRWGCYIGCLIYLFVMLLGQCAEDVDKKRAVQQARREQRREMQRKAEKSTRKSSAVPPRKSEKSPAPALFPGRSAKSHQEVLDIFERQLKSEKRESRTSSRPAPRPPGKPARTPGSTTRPEVKPVSSPESVPPPVELPREPSRLDRISIGILDVSKQRGVYPHNQSSMERVHVRLQMQADRPAHAMLPDFYLRDSRGNIFAPVNSTAIRTQYFSRDPQSGRGTLDLCFEVPGGRHWLLEISSGLAGEEPRLLQWK